MNKKLRKLLTIPTLLAIILTGTAFGFRPIFHPPTVSIVDALGNDETNFSVLIGLIRESGLKELNEQGQAYTLLAPTNEAFAKLPEKTLRSLKKDKNKLRQLLFNHLLSGKVLFKKMFEPDTPTDEGKRTSKTLTNLDDRLVELLCDEHYANKGNVHLPLINGKARVLEGDFEGDSAVIHVIDTVLIPDDKNESIGVDSGSPVRNEVANGLSTTTFDTLVGTVTVNLPDDLAAGDTISGTVNTEPRKQTAPAGQAKNEMPMAQEKAQDELSGYVVEVAKQETPIKKGDGNVTDSGQNPAQCNDFHFINVCKKWSIPEGVSKIPVVLKNKEGKIVGRADLPVAPKANPAKVTEGLLTPAVGQAGKPLSVKGTFDGDFANTAIKMGNLTAKFLAASPRKVVVESPRDLKGVNDITVEYKGKVVAKCTYRSISIRLSADKLNLIKGETTGLTVTLAGLIGLLTPVEIQLTNKSPETVSIVGGNTQTITVNPAASGDHFNSGKSQSGDIFIAKRTLTGVKAGGFSINAAIDPATSIQGNCNQGIEPGTPIYGPDPHGQPLPTPLPTPGNVDADGNPRRNDGPGRPVNPFRARFRVTMNGFLVNHATNHGLLRSSDGVALHPHVEMVDTTGRLQEPQMQHRIANAIGVIREFPTRGGSAEPNGGFLTGDGFPTQTTPWRRTVPYSSGLPGGTPPTIYFEDEIVQNTNAAVIIPNIWSHDGFTNLGLRTSYFNEIDRARAEINRAVAGMITRPARLELSNFLKPGSALGIRNTVSLAFGVPQNRPVGVHPVGNQFGFTPQVLVLTYEAADYISRNSFGFGTGIVPVRYVDASGFDGDYTLFLQVENLDTMPPCNENIIGSVFTGSAVLTTNNHDAPGPYPGAVENMRVNFTDCRGIIQITDFPPLVSNSETRVGPNRATMTMVAGGAGTFNPINGGIDMPITLGLVNTNGLFGNSTLPLRLTGTINRITGEVTLSGTGRFSGGQLGSASTDGTVTVTGTFSPSP